MLTGGARVERHTLLERLASTRVCVIEAPGGFGKSTLAHELAARHEIAAVSIDLGTVVGLGARTTKTVLVGLMVEAFRQAGLADLAEAAARTSGDEAGDLDAIAAAHDDPLCIIFDDAERLDDDASRWLARRVDALGPDSRAIIVGRHLPPALAAIGDATVDADELRFTAADIDALLEPIGDVGAAGQLAAELIRHTGGWPVAVDVMVAQRLRRPAEPTAGPRAFADVMSDIVSELLASRSVEERAALARLAAVPLLAQDVATALGDPRSLDTALAAGLPVGRRSDGWLTLPDPVRIALRPPGSTPLAPETARAVAEVYCRTGELSAAVHLLHSVDDVDGVAAVIGRRPWTELEAAGVAFARLVVDIVADVETDESIGLMVALARAVEHDDPTLRSTILEAADRSTAGGNSPLRRSVAAELANDASRRGDPATADTLVAEAVSGPAREATTRARARFAGGIAETIRSTPEALRRAREAFGESAALAELAGQYRWCADALVRLGYAVEFHGGDIDAAAAPIERALALTPAPDRSRAVTLTYLADVLDHAGRVTEAEAACREALAIGRRLRDLRVIGYACWSSAWVAAHRGDRDAALDWLHEATRQYGPWLEHANGAEFYLAAADMLLALGDEAAALPFLEIGRQRTEAFDIPDAFAPVAARHAAMFGDPAAAEELLADLDGRPFAVLLGRWSTAMQRAYAAHRRGDADGARRFRAVALAEATRCGYPDLPARHERYLDAELRRYDGPIGDESSPAAVELRLLGTFALDGGGVDHTPPHGHPATLVKLLTLRGAMTVDEMIDELWPDTDPTTARARLRNTLNRLRSRAGDVVRRRGEVLELDADVTVDVDAFERASEQALAAPDHERAGLARRATALYSGDLLPGDRYADWAAAPHERLRRRFLALSDLLADDAERRGDFDEAVRQLDAGMRVEPLDERRPVRAARLLVAQGRRASAREAVRQAMAVVEELGITASADLRSLDDQLSR